MRMATAFGTISRGFAGSWIQLKDEKKKKGMMRNEARARVSCSYSSAPAKTDPYQTLKIQRGASESEVRKAFRKLALQYHPDVCRGSDCGVQFHSINEAYDFVMSNLREEPEMYEQNDPELEEQMKWMNEHPEWDMWEEWMGFEGAGTRDYSSHVNPYV